MSNEPLDMARAVVIRHEEVAEADKTGWRGAGFLRARRKVETHRVDELIPTNGEKVVLEHVPANANDDGKIETLPDGSVSIPVYAEELVVTKRTVLRERIVIRKEVVAVEQQVVDELRREIVDIDADDGIEVREPDEHS